MPIRMPDPLHPRPASPGTTTLRRGLRRSARLVSFSACLEVEMLRALRRTEGVVRVDELPEAFEWRDGLDGSERMHLPLARVDRSGGDVAYVDALPRSVLERDPTMGGVRVRVELECAARGASYEVWTEDEIRQDPTAVNLARVAGPAERVALSRTVPGSPAPLPPPIVAAAAGRLGIDRLTRYGGAWIGRSILTGIAMSLLDGLAPDPESGVAVWRPHAAARPAPVRGPVPVRRRRTDGTTGAPGGCGDVVGTGRGVRAAIGNGPADDGSTHDAVRGSGATLGLRGQPAGPRFAPD